MILSTMMLCAVAAAPGQTKLASPGLTGVQVTKDEATFYSDHLAQQLALKGLAVMTATEINSLLGLERQRQLMGCSSEASSCMAELADALGVDGIVTGSIGKFGNVFQIDVKVVAANDGRRLAIFSGAAKSEREVLETLSGAAGAISDQVLTSLGRATVTASSSRGLRKVALVPGGIGVVAIVVGAVLMGQVAGVANDLRGANGMASTLDYTGAMAALQRGMTEQVIGIVCLSVGGVALAAAAAMFLFSDSPVTVTPSVGPTSAGAMVQLRLP